MEGIFMRKKRFVWLFSPLLCLAISGCNRMGNVPAADLVIENAKVVTIDKANPRAQAIAIESYTLGSAYAEFTEDRKGMIKAGYLGDVVIFNQDLMTMPHEKIMSAKVDYTIVGGKVVYKREGAE